MSDRGYLIVATNFEEQHNAAICAYSIKLSNPNASITLCTERGESSLHEHLKQPFDSVIKLPFSMDKKHRRINDWQLYWATPYEYTMVIDCMTLINQNQDTLWDLLIEHHNIAFSQERVDFKGNKVQIDNKVYQEYMIPQLNSQIFFFNKSDASLEYFKLIDPIFKNWYSALTSLIGGTFIPEEFDSDLMHSVIMSITWEPEYNICNDEFCIIDLAMSKELFYQKCPDSWQQYINTWVDKNSTVKVQNFNPVGVLYYAESNFGTQELYEQYRTNYTERFTNH